MKEVGRNKPPGRKFPGGNTEEGAFPAASNLHRTHNGTPLSLEWACFAGRFTGLPQAGRHAAILCNGPPSRPNCATTRFPYWYAGGLKLPGKLVLSHLS